MKFKFLAVLSLIIVFISSCVQTTERAKRPKRPTVQTLRYVDGTIKSINGDQVTIQIALPEFETSSLPFTNRIAQEVINKCFLLENIETKVENQDVRVEKISDDLLILNFARRPKFKIGDSIKISIPKKTIAITDFEVIRGYDKTIGIVSMESLITAFVNSGQFNVVERSKLKTILQELKLGTMGLIDPNNAKEFGKLLQADLILIGSFADLGGYWNTNLRLINVRTGIIVAAFEEKASFSDIKPTAVRDTTNLKESFEGKLKPGWVIGSSERFNARRSVKVDHNTGANNTPSSMLMSFKLIADGAWAPIMNNRKRDLSPYTGVEFYAKSDQGLSAVFAIKDENFNDNSKHDRWYAIFEVNTTWQKYRINFGDMSLAQNFARKRPGGDGTLSSHLVTSFDFNVNAFLNYVGTSGKLWIDEIRFF